MNTLTMFKHQMPLRTLVAAIAFAAAGMANAAGYENPTGLKAADFVPAPMLQGELYSVSENVTLEGGLPRFTIKSQYGEWQARGREMLEIRISELPAFVQVDKISKTDEFAKAAGKALAAPVEAVGELVAHPVDTVSNIGSGIGLIASRIANMAGQAANKVGDTVSGDTKAQKPILKEQPAISEGVAKPRAVIGGPLGYNSARRDWAQQLKVDPYTNNAALSDKLGDLAAASFAGSFPVNLTLGMVAAPLQYTVQFNEQGQLEAYQYSPIDIEMRNTDRLKKMGVEGLPVRTLMRNSYFTPTLQTSLVLALESLGNVPGRVAVVEFASRAASDIEARYVINSIGLLTQYSRTVTPITVVQSADNVLAAGTADGKMIIPVAMDYIPWVKPVDDFAHRTDLTGSERRVLVSGIVTPQAKEELAKLGWQVSDNLAAGR
jgi:hypothetical protein